MEQFPLRDLFVLDLSLVTILLDQQQRSFTKICKLQLPSSLCTFSTYDPHLGQTISSTCGTTLFLRRRSIKPLPLSIECYVYG